MKLSTLTYRLFKTLWSFWPFRRETAILIRATGIHVGKYERDIWFEGRFKVPFENKNLTLFASRYDHSSLAVFWNGLDQGWDAMSLKIWSNLARHAEVIYDVGANIGLYALTAGLVNPKAQITAFEPGFNTQKILKKNVALNQLNVTIVPIALSNQNDLAEFHDLTIPSAVSSLKKSKVLTSDPNYISYQVPLRRMDDYVAELDGRKPDLISIDVEKNESEVLEGMGKLIQDSQPDFIIEILDSEMAEKITPFFISTTYQYFQIIENQGIVQCCDLKRTVANGYGYNFLICKPDSLKRLTDIPFMDSNQTISQTETQKS